MNLIIHLEKKDRSKHFEFGIRKTFVVSIKDVSERSINRHGDWAIGDDSVMSCLA